MSDMESLSKLESIVKSSPLKTICTECTAIYPAYGSHSNLNWLFERANGGYKITCQVCGKMYAKQNPKRPDDAPLTKQNYEIGLGDERGNTASSIASIASHFYPHISLTSFKNQNFYPPTLLYRAIGFAQYFVHFLTRSVDSKMLEHIEKTKAHVRGFISATEGINNLSRLEHLNKGTWQRGLGFYHGIHTKLVIIDGVIAFKGSANLSEFAWRGAFGNYPKDIVEVVLDPLEIARLNNFYFAPSWLNGQSVIKKNRNHTPNLTRKAL